MHINHPISHSNHTIILILILFQTKQKIIYFSSILHRPTQQIVKANYSLALTKRKPSCVAQQQQTTNNNKCILHQKKWIKINKITKQSQTKQK